MIGFSFVRRLLVGLALACATGAATAFSYGILAAGVLAGAIAVVAAPYVGIALTVAQITGVMGAAAVHSALAAYIFGQPVKPPPNAAPAMVTLINKAAATAKPVKVNLSPMTPAAKAKYQAAKTAAVTAASVTPTAATPPSGKGAAEASARSQLGPGLAYHQTNFSSYNYVIVCSDDTVWSNISCSVDCTNSSNCRFQYVDGMPLVAIVNYTPSKPGVSCPAGSHQSGSACTVDKDPNADTIVNDGSPTPQWNPAGMPDDGKLSDDGSTLCRGQANADGTTTSSCATLQPDGSLNMVDSTFDPKVGQTVHSGYAVDTNGVVQGTGAAVSPGNYSGVPGGGITFPNGNNPNGVGQGGGGGCGSAEKPNCDINFGTPDAGPAVADADPGEFVAAMSTTVFDGLLAFKLPDHASKCPTMDVSTEYFRKSGVASTAKACDFVDLNRATLSSIFMLIWAIAALFLILSA